MTQIEFAKFYVISMGFPYFYKTALLKLPHIKYAGILAENNTIDEGIAVTLQSDGSVLLTGEFRLIYNAEWFDDLKPNLYVRNINEEERRILFVYEE